MFFIRAISILSQAWWAAAQAQLHGVTATPNRNGSAPKKAANIQVVAELSDVNGSLGMIEIALGQRHDNRWVRPVFQILRCQVWERQSLRT